MKTYIDYDTEVEENAKIIKELPDSFFDCPKMNIGDLMSLCFNQSEKDNILTPVRVTNVSINIEWEESTTVKSFMEVKSVEQYLYVTPEIETNVSTLSRQ